MAKNEPTTKPTNKDIDEFILEIEHKTRQADSKILLELFKKVTKEKPVIWGTKIVGFGTYQYESKTCKGNWPMTGFAPNKANLSLYIMNGFKRYDDIIKRLGKCKISVGCLRINKLADVNLDVLEELIEDSYNYMKEKYK